MLIKIAGRVRGLFSGNYPENREDEQFHLNSRGDQIVAQGLPELTEIVRLGDSWQVSTATGTASVQAIPTTNAGLAVWNGESAGGKSYVIDSVAAHEIVVDATQSNMTTLYVMNNKTPVAAVTDDALTIRSLSGRTYGGRARTQLLARTVVNDGWFPCGTSAPAAAAANGSAWKCVDVPLRGMYIVPPGGQFNLIAAKVAATAAQMIYTIRWHEVQLIVKS
jgi:hypothetical protein